MTANNRRRGEQGQVLVLFVLALATLLGMAALVMDVGAFMVEKRKLQNAADAAALAAAYELPASATVAEGAARDWAAANGYGDNTMIDVQTPYGGDPDKVEVTISGQTTPFFARVFGRDVFQTEGRAVATRSRAATQQVSILALSPDACRSLDKIGSSDVIVTAGVVVNSSCDQAIRITGSGDIIAANIGYNEEGGWSEAGPGAVVPAPQPMYDQVSDPFAGLPEPSLTALGASPDSGGTAAAPNLKQVNGSTVLGPGVYYGGLKINGPARVTLLPGIYIMAGGGFSFQGSVMLTGLGVMIFNTGYGSVPCGGVNLAGGANGTLTPPATGLYAGILFWQDNDCHEEFVHAGGNAFQSGAYYVPGAQMTLTGTSAMGATAIVANTLKIGGTADVTVGVGVAATSGRDLLRLTE